MYKLEQDENSPGDLDPIPACCDWSSIIPGAGAFSTGTQNVADGSCT